MSIPFKWKQTHVMNPRVFLDCKRVAVRRKRNALFYKYHYFTYFLNSKNSIITKQNKCVR